MIYNIVRRSNDIPSSVQADSLTITDGGTLVFRNQRLDTPDAWDLVLSVAPQGWIAVAPAADQTEV